MHFFVGVRKVLYQGLKGVSTLTNVNSIHVIHQLNVLILEDLTDVFVQLVLQEIHSEQVAPFLIIVRWTLIVKSLKHASNTVAQILVPLLIVV